MSSIVVTVTSHCETAIYGSVEVARLGKIYAFVLGTRGHDYLHLTAERGRTVASHQLSDAREAVRAHCAAIIESERAETAARLAARRDEIQNGRLSEIEAESDPVRGFAMCRDFLSEYSHVATDATFARATALRDKFEAASRMVAQPKSDFHPLYNRDNFKHFVCNNGNFDIYANDSGYCASLPTEAGASIGCKASHFGDSAYVKATLGVTVQVPQPVQQPQARDMRPAEPGPNPRFVFVTTFDGRPHLKASDTKGRSHGYSAPFAGPVHDLSQPIRERLGERRAHGPMLAAPARPGAERAFYAAMVSGLECAHFGSSFGLRIETCGSPYRHGEGEDVIPIVFRLPRGRGFLPGWTMGQGMCGGIDPSRIYESAREAGFPARSMAEHAAEQNSEDPDGEEVDGDEMESEFASNSL